MAGEIDEWILTQKVTVHRKTYYNSDFKLVRACLRTRKIKILNLCVKSVFVSKNNVYITPVSRSFNVCFYLFHSHLV